MSHVRSTMQKKSLSPAIIAIASVIIGIALFIVLWPPSERWGPSNSPARQGLYYLYVFLIYVIPGAMAIKLFGQRPEWLAPPGRYVEGAKYSVFSPYALAASAIVAAVATVAGIPGPINIDTVAMVTAFAAAYFGPAVAFLGTSVAFILRYLLGLAPWVATPNIVVAYALMDGGIWAINSYLFWSVVRGRKLKGGVKTVMTLVMAFVGVGVHFFGWCILNYFTNNPYAAAVGSLMWAIGPTGFVISSIVAQIIGWLIGAFYYDSRAAGA